jgi:hypothetical protein
MLAPHRFMRLVQLDEGQQPTDVRKKELFAKLKAWHFVTT